METAETINPRLETSELLFEVHKTKLGFFAIRDSSPRFALFSTTLEELSRKTEKALRFADAYSGKPL